MPERVGHPLTVDEKKYDREFSFWWDGDCPRGAGSIIAWLEKLAPGNGRVEITAQCGPELVPQAQNMKKAFNKITTFDQAHPLHPLLFSKCAQPGNTGMENKSTSFPSRDFADEICGSRMLGMKRTTLKLVGKVFSKKRISTEEFRESLTAITAFSAARRFKVEVEAVYDRLGSRRKKKVWLEMLIFYRNIGDWSKAADLVQPALVLNSSQFYYAMDCYLRAQRMKDADVLRYQGFRFLKGPNGTLQMDLIADVLGRFNAYCGDWDEALVLWSQISTAEPCFINQADLAMVELCLARAMGLARRALDRLTHVPISADPSASGDVRAKAISNRETQKALLKFQRHLEKALPLRRQKEYGL